VNHDYRGYPKFSLNQVEKIRASILHIDKKKAFYSGIKFVDTCFYDHWQVSKYDTSLPM